jgi:hypothetical protein
MTEKALNYNGLGLFFIGLINFLTEIASKKIIIKK